MVPTGIYRNADEIRQLLIDHGKELTQGNQEIKIAWKGTMSVPSIGLLHSYKPQGDDRYSDALIMYFGGVVYIISPPQITFFQVLPTKKITGDTFMSDMRQCEHAGGLDAPK
jgi:hypothetical protein